MLKTLFAFLAACGVCGMLAFADAALPTAQWLAMFGRFAVLMLIGAAGVKLCDGRRESP